MSLWRQLTRGLRVLTNRRAADQDVSDEVHHYLEQAAAALEVRGLSPEEARRSARIELGNTTTVREQVRAYGWENFIGAFFADLRYAARRLHSNLGFTAVAAITLALGIGASTAIFSAVNPILFEPLPYPHPGRVAMIWERRSNSSPLAVTFGSFFGVSNRSRSFEALAVMKPWQPTMTSAAEPERFEGQRVSSAYFRALGVSPATERDFQSSDDTFKGPNVVIISDRLWRRRFASDTAIVGRQITLDDNLYTVIGLMPRSFENVLAPSAELWAPLQYDTTLPSDGREWGHHLRMVGRLRPAVSMDQARSELDVFLHILGQMYVKGYDSSGGVPSGFLVNSLQSDLTRGVRPALLAVLGAVLFVLLIACVNVTNLLLARGAQRRGEFAMRVALGAGRSRLIRQLLTESLLLSLLGGVLGMVVALNGMRVLVALSPAELPRVAAIRLDGTVFAFALGLTTLVGLAVGLIPALHASRSSPQSGLQQISRRTAGSHQWTRRTLVVSEVALALVLLVSAGLLLRSLQQLFAIAPGFDASHLLTMQVQESGHRFDADRDRDRFFTLALEAVRKVPGVTAAAFTSQLPLSGDFESYGVEFESYPNETAEPAFRYAVTPGYFETTHIPLRRGRLLNDHDRPGAPVAVLISESYANRKFPTQDPLGMRVRIGPDIGHADKPWATIVGVVGDVKQTSLAISEPDAFYTSSTQWAWVDNVQSLVVRTRGDAASLAPAIRKAIWSVDKDQPIVRVATMDSLLAASEAERHFALVLFESFALVALVLAATGIYGVLSGSVTERIREIGIRAALGATRANILTLVVRQGMTLTFLGVLIGLAGAVAATQALVTLLFGTSRLDPLTYLGVIALLLSVSAIACWIPAWRAAQVDPAITLRAE
jgi:putative ABC transport system permease protein